MSDAYGTQNTSLKLNSTCNIVKSPKTLLNKPHSDLFLHMSVSLPLWQSRPSGISLKVWLLKTYYLIATQTDKVSLSLTKAVHLHVSWPSQTLLIWFLLFCNACSIITRGNCMISVLNGLRLLTDVLSFKLTWLKRRFLALVCEVLSSNQVRLTGFWKQNLMFLSVCITLAK